MRGWEWIVCWWVLVVISKTQGQSAPVPTIPVFVTAQILDIRVINDQGASFEAEVEWIFEWESADVTALNTSNNQSWQPLIISNNKVSDLLKYPDHFIPGATCTLHRREVLDRIRLFPFDTQHPHILVEPEVSRDYVVQLIPTQTGSRQKELLQHKDDFHVEGWDDFNDPSIKTFAERTIIGTPSYGVEFSLSTDREYTPYLVQNVFPAAIFVAIAFAGFWIDFTSLMPRLMPILFATVALANLNTSTSNFITRGGNISFFEAFALHSTVISALVLVELVVVHNLGRRKLREGAILVDKVCRLAFPWVYVNITFFLVLLLAVEAPLWASLLFLFGGLALLVLIVSLYLVYRTLYYYRIKKKSKEQE